MLLTFYFTNRPSIMGYQENRLCGEPPRLDFQFDIDDEYQYNKQIIFKLIDKAYDRVELYFERFDPIRKDYERDLRTDPEEINYVKGKIQFNYVQKSIGFDENIPFSFDFSLLTIYFLDIASLRQFCERYVNEMASLEGILPEINLGLLKLRQNTFKEKIIPVCRDLVSVLERHLPKLAIESVAQTQEKLEEIMVKIQNYPNDTMSYVNYMRYTDQCATIISKMEEEFKYAYEVFVLMKQFNVPVDDLEKDKYLDVEEYLVTLKKTLDEKLALRDDFVQKLSQLLQNDIRLVFEEVDDVMKKSVESWLISEDSNKGAVKECLQGLNDRLSACQGLSQDYKKYQREFKVMLS